MSTVDQPSQPQSSSPLLLQQRQQQQVDTTTTTTHSNSPSMSCISDAFCNAVDKVVYPILPDFLKSSWNHPAGPKTVFFWAPTIKWCLVLAGLADMMRPADKLSLYQNVSLFITGAIWTRYSFAITPVNYNLASVNFFLCTVALFQLARLGYYEAFIRDSYVNATALNTSFT